MPLSNGYNLGLLVDGVEGEEHYLDLMKLWRGLDGLVMPRVEDKDRTAPPVNIVNGQMYIIPAGATGAWAGRTNMIARGFTVGTGAPAWQYFLPKKGWSMMVLDEGDKDGVPIEYRFTGTEWRKPDLGPTREEVLINPMTTLGDTLYANEDGTAVRLGVGRDLQVLTSLDGVPQWRDPPVNSGGGGEGGDFTNPMLASQDLIVGGDTPPGTPTRLGKGQPGQSLQINATGMIFWGPQASGGFQNPMTTLGDLIYGGTNGVALRLAKGDDGLVLKMVGGVPQWTVESGGGSGGFQNPMTAARDLIIGGAGGTPLRLPNGTAGQVLGSNGWVTLQDSVPTAALGVTVATLDAGGKVPSGQLPSYVDDVLEFFTLSAFPFPGESGKIYIALNTNKTYRWPDGGSDYVELVGSPGTTDNVPEGTTNKYWTVARTLGQALTGLITTTAGTITATDTVLAAFGKLQNAINTITTSVSNRALKGINADITSLTAYAANFVATSTGFILGSAAIPWAQLFLGKLTMSGAVNNAAQVTLAIPSSGANQGIVNIAAAASNSVILTGTTGIGSLGASPSPDVAAGVQRWVRFADGCDLYHSVALVLPGAVNMTTRPGDVAVFECTSAGWRMQHFMRADGTITYTGGTLSKAINLAPMVVVASAGNLALENVAANTVRITGVAYIGSLGNLPNGSRRRLIFDGAASLAASSAMLLPGGASITAAVGDVADFEMTDTGGAWKLTNYFRATGEALTATTGGTNANGSWVKHPDGTLMQMMSVVIAGPTIVGSITSPSLTFPQPFYDMKVALTSNVQTSLPNRFNTAAAINNTTQYVASISDTGGGISNATVQVIAIGRWKA